MANYNGREAFYSWSRSNYCIQSFGVGRTQTVQPMPGSGTLTIAPEISLMMTASPSPAQFSSNQPMMISPGYFVSAPFTLLSTMVTLNPGTFQPQSYIPEEIQFQNIFQTLQIQDQPEPFVTSQSALAPEFLSSYSLGYQPPPAEFRFFPSTGNTLLVDMTVPTMIDQGTQWVLLPLSQWASAPAPVQQQVLREMIDSRYATGPSLYSKMKGLATAGKLGRRGKPCGFCVSKKEANFFARSHVLRDQSGIVRCPVLRRVICKVCHATGDNAHTAQYCPLKKNEGEGVTGGSGVRENLPKRSRYARNSAGKQ